KTDKRLVQMHLEDEAVKLFRGIWKGIKQEDRVQAADESWTWDIPIPRDTYPQLLKDIAAVQLQLLTTDIHAHFNAVSQQPDRQELTFVSELASVIPKKANAPTDY